MQPKLCPCFQKTPPENSIFSLEFFPEGCRREGVFLSKLEISKIQHCLTESTGELGLVGFSGWRKFCLKFIYGHGLQEKNKNSLCFHKETCFRLKTRALLKRRLHCSQLQPLTCPPLPLQKPLPVSKCGSTIFSASAAPFL